MNNQNIETVVMKKFANKNMVVLQKNKIYSPKTGKVIEINGKLFMKMLKEFEFNERQNILMPYNNIEYVFDCKLERYRLISS